MPKVMAHKSITNDATRARSPRTKRRPVAIERKMGWPVSCSYVFGGCGRMRYAASTIPPHVAASAMYAPWTPAASMRTPPRPGPTTIVSWYSPKVSDSEAHDYYVAHKSQYPPTRDVEEILVGKNKQALAQSIYSRVKGGADFAKLAKQFQVAIFRFAGRETRHFYLRSYSPLRESGKCFHYFLRKAR